MGRKLTHKQQRFADEYIKTGNATQSAIEAGYSKNSARSIGHENLNKPYIRDYIQKKQKEIQDATIADAIEIQQRLTRVLRGEEEEEVLQFLPEGGQKLITKTPSITDRIKAAELMGKRYAMFTDNINADVEGQVVIVDDLDEEG